MENRPMMAQVLDTYINVTTEEEAADWIDKQPCSPVKKSTFMAIAATSLAGRRIMADGWLSGKPIEIYKHEDQCMDYIDSLRSVRICTGKNVGG